MRGLGRFSALAEDEFDFRTEAEAGLAGFMALAYTFLVNALLLERAGVFFGEAYMALVLSFAVANIAAALLTRQPLILVPGIAVNMYFSYIIVVSNGIPYGEGLALLLFASLTFGVISFSGWRQKIMDAVPLVIRQGMRAGVGALLLLLGLSFGGIIVVSPFQLTSFGDLGNPAAYLTVSGFLLTAGLKINKVRGAYFAGMVFTAAGAIMLGCIDWPGGIFCLPAGMERTICGWSFNNLAEHLGFGLMLLFIMLFDSSIAVSALFEGKDSQNSLAVCYKADSAGGIISAFLGVAPAVYTPEAAVACQYGGKTGLVPAVAACIGLAALFCGPIVRELACCPAVIAPLLIFTGLELFSSIGRVMCKDMPETVSVYLMVFLMALTNNPALGLGAGIVLFVLLKLLSGCREELTGEMYGLAMVFVLYFINLAI